MKIVGIFRELERSASRALPSIHDARDGMSHEMAQRVASYLRQGEPVVDVMEYTVDPFDRSKGVSGGPSLLTDGDWAWRYDLLYYVDNYRISLPEEFIDHALKNDIKAIDRPSLLRDWRLSFDAYNAELK